MSSSAMATAAADDDDWVDVAEEFCGPEEWVVLVGDEGSMAAVFFGRAAAGIGPGTAAPIPLVGPADAAAGCGGRVLLSSPSVGGSAPLPPAPTGSPGPDDAIAASRGRVLLSGPWSRYYVLDPSAGARHALPRPGRATSPRDAAITCDAGGSYWVVCAFSDGFEVYASSTGTWREVRFAAASALLPGSAAAFEGWVF
ncbi:hypothetical protein BS78_02G072300 [Paspalum vaginatum]|nr:hypothetical protein BS78_02G072300 [Paspalum vaginatum]